MKRLFRLFQFNSINQKIIVGFLIIYFFFIINAILSIFIINQNATSIEVASKNMNPSIDKLYEFRFMITQSELYTFSWVYEQTESRQQDREALKKIHLDFPEFKDNVTKLMKTWKNRRLATQLDSVFTNFETLRKHQESVMEKLAESDDYFDATVKLEAEKILNNDVLPYASAMLEKLNVILAQKTQERKENEASMIDSFNWLTNVISVFGTVLIFMGFIVSWWTRRQIVRPIKYINSVFVKLGTGELPEDKYYHFNKDEIGEMANSADRLVYGLKSTSLFAENIGKGNYNASYQPLSEKDVLGNALLEMRENLSRVAEDDKRRSWTNEGLVKFGELLKSNENIEKLSDSIISNLVKYVNANQGGLFIIENNETDAKSRNEEPYMRLYACYAWDKKKYLEQQVFKGDGLAGQAWQEQATIYLDEVPKDYVMITSGLGEANPKSILIVPLKLNEEVFGVFELASFFTFKDYEITFVEKIAENVAATLASAKIAERTRKLLDESTLMTEQMKSQEEEMRQNMEELQAQQESTAKSQREAQEKEELFNASYLVIETDKKFNVQKVNELTEIKLKYELEEFDGMAIDYLFFSYDKIEEAKTKLEKGNKWNGFAQLKGKNNVKIATKITASAMLDDYGNLNKYLFLIDDITEAKN